MKRTTLVLMTALLFAACNGDEQEHDVQEGQHATPTPMPASQPADTVGAAGAHDAHTTTTDSAAPTTTH